MLQDLYVDSMFVLGQTLLLRLVVMVITVVFEGSCRVPTMITVVVTVSILFLSMIIDFCFMIC
jgi:hypothetical protein